MQKLQSWIQAIIQRLGVAGVLLPISIFLLLIFFWLGRVQILTLRAAGETQVRSLADAAGEMFLPVIFNNYDSDVPRPGPGGNVFRDYNANGTQDLYEPGVAGIIVSAYNADGSEAASTITDAQGGYILSLPANESFRLEFTGIPDYLQPGVVGNDTEATVAFVTGSSSDVSVGLNNPADYCQENPELATPCYIFGDQDNEPALVSFHNQAGSDKLKLADDDPTDPDSPYGTLSYDDANNAVDGIQVHPIEAWTQDIGPTYGLAHQRSLDVLFAGAFMKRHSGFGPGGTGAIYRVPRPSGPISVYADLNVIFGPDTAGDNPHDSSGSSDVNAYFFHDPSFDEVGKISLGDMEITDDEKYLYTVNLADKMLYRIPVLDEATPAFTTGDILRRSTPTPSGCAESDSRPFGLGTNDGTLYVGIVCSAQSMQQASDMHAYVYSFDGASFSQQPVLDFPLDYTRACADRDPDAPPPPPEAPCLRNADALWKPWLTTFGELLDKTGQNKWVTYPQPLLSDIEFANGYMIVGLRDRNGDMIGNGAGDPRNNGVPTEDPPPPSGLDDQFLTVTAGDILAAAPDPNSPGRWKLEDNAAVGNRQTAGANNGNGPGGGEYFFEESFAIDSSTPPALRRPRHDEGAQGGLTNIPGQVDALTTSLNPIPIEGYYYDGGVMWLSGQNGTRSRSYRVFNGEEPTHDVTSLPGKNNGLGDLEVLCEPAPLEIGDRVWIDADRDGIQDPGEEPLAGVSVKLYAPDMTTLLATAVTNAEGNYYFSNAAPPGPQSAQSSSHAVYGVDGLQPNTTGYKLRIDLTQAVIADNNYVLTQANADGHTDNNNKTDLRDSDAITSGENAEITFDSGGAGHNNHTLDFGFVLHQDRVAVGNRVWLDDGVGGGIIRDGIVNGSETGIDGVVVQLYPDSGVSGTPLQTTITANNGCYLFDNLEEGKYIIHIPASQFDEVGPLLGLVSSLPQGDDNQKDDNMDENGQNTPVNGGISSTMIELALGAEPEGEPSRSLCFSMQADNNEDMTVDFGFATPPEPGIEIIKYTNGEDANELPDVPLIPPGEPVTWTYQVKNTGNVSFPKEDVVVTDSRGEIPLFDSVLVGDNDDNLDPGEVWLYKAMGTAIAVGPPPLPGTIPTLWGIDEKQRALFSVDDYTKIPDGAAAAGVTIYSPLQYTNKDGVTSDININGYIGTFTIDSDNVSYLAYNNDLKQGVGLPPLKAPVLMKFDLDNASTTGGNIVEVIGSIPIPGFELGPLVEKNISGMSIDPATGELYVMYHLADDETPDKLLIVSKEDASLIEDLGEIRNDTLGVVSEDGDSIEFDQYGNLYESDTWDDHLYQVDPETAQIMSIVDENQRGGLTGIGPVTSTDGLAWDAVTDTMVAHDDKNDLFYILTLENGNNMSLGTLPGLTYVEAIDIRITACYMNVGEVTATVTVPDGPSSVSDTDPSHYCN